MKDTFTDANFPKTADGRVYHLGLRIGEVANRIITVGSPSRADAIASFLDGPQDQIFKLSSERGFLTITGRYKGIPVSIVSIGMGYPNMDFFVREIRECVSGELVIVRLGSCGGLVDTPVGSLVVPSASVAIRRNYDFDFANETGDAANSSPYEISKSVPADQRLHVKLVDTLRETPNLDPPVPILGGTVNASADSFYSSQGRQTSFPDHNEGLIDLLLKSVPNLATLEMETYHLLHLASVWRPRKRSHDGRYEGTTDQRIPPTSKPVTPALEPAPSSQPGLLIEKAEPVEPRIRAASVQMIFANRLSQDFINPQRVLDLEAWSGRAVLDAITSFDIASEGLHDTKGSVWERT